MQVAWKQISIMDDKLNDGDISVQCENGPRRKLMRVRELEDGLTEQGANP